MKRRDRRARTTGRFERGDRFAQIPREVLESDAYRAIPHYCARVLLALVVQYAGSRNGSLALPWTEAQRLGVRTQAQLYSGLRVLEEAELIACTRRGYLRDGRRLASLYALTWRGIDTPSPAGVVYDSGISECPIPTNRWAKWTRPAHWDDFVRDTRRRASGKLTTRCPFAKRSADSPLEGAASHPVSSGKDPSRSPRAESETANPAHPVGVTSKNPGLGARSDVDGHQR
jgi:hypothetical protein